MIENINIRQIEEDVMHNNHENVIKQLLDIIPPDKENKESRTLIIMVGLRIFNLRYRRMIGTISYEDYMCSLSQESVSILEIVNRLIK